jgi:hypothetical protein
MPQVAITKSPGAAHGTRCASGGDRRCMARRLDIGDGRAMVIRKCRSRQEAAMISTSRAVRRSGSLQANAAPAVFAAGVFPDQFDTGAIERADHLHHRIHDAAHRTLARLHALDRRQGHARHFRQGFLIDTQERPPRTHL